ncbi:MAG TPA: hypothetical protein VIC07_05485 [Acidimicrobiia bacterium]
MADRLTEEKWLRRLTFLPTAPGIEDAVISWVGTWVARRPDLTLARDTGGNLLIAMKGRRAKRPVLAVAHMDHPAFVITASSQGEALFEFRGGVRAEYFEGARVEIGERKVVGRVVSYAPETGRGTIRHRGADPPAGTIARWAIAEQPEPPGRLLAPACDDLAGVVAALAALDRARGVTGLSHFGVLLTRAEELGFVGAIHAAKTGVIADGSRLLSIEASRTSTDAPIGHGPVIRVGDASSVFDHELTNSVSAAAMRSGIRHQRKLMAGGSCEATAFGAYGLRATGLCLPLGNYHNQGRLDAVEAGRSRGRAMMEEISLEDFHGLVDLLLVAAEGVDRPLDLRGRLDDFHSARLHLISPPEDRGLGT